MSTDDDMGAADDGGAADDRGAGFTLIETLVAMAVLAVASAGLLRAVAAHVDLIAGLETRAGARWVAENRLVELRLGMGALPAAVDMLGRRWRVTTTARASDDTDIVALTVAVGLPGAPPLIRLDGFRDGGSRDEGER